MEPEFIKFILRWIIYTLLGSFAIFCAYHCVNMGIRMNTDILECGTVVSKFSDEVAMKHGTRTELILIVKWDSNVSKHRDGDVNVTPTTYQSTKVGQRVCFKNTAAYYAGVEILWAVIGILEIVVGFIWLVEKARIWIFNIEDED